MPEESTSAILITTSLDGERGPGRTERGLSDAVAESVLKAVPVQVLKTNMGHFFDQLRDILSTGPETIGDFEVSQVEVSAQITGDGQVSLIGSGLKIGVKGGVTFVLKRAQG